MSKMKVAERSLASYLEASKSIEGWFSSDAAIMFVAYNQLLKAMDISGDVLEIGVYRGKSAITLASLRGHYRRFFASDLFVDMQSYGSDGASTGLKSAFLANLAAFYGDTDFVQLLVGSSSDLRTTDFADHHFSFCHIDGDHSLRGVYGDLGLCYDLLMPGGILALDDYFNPLFPGVSEAATKFFFERERALRPVALGFNKALFQKVTEGSAELNTLFRERFKYLPVTIVDLMGEPAHLFNFDLTPFVDLHRSTVDCLAPRSDLALAAQIEAAATSIAVEAGQAASLPVRVVNDSSVPFQWGIALSYHLLSQDGEVIQWDNPRSIFNPPLQPGEECVVHMGVQAPSTPGAYRLEIDLVWERVTWFKERGNRTNVVALAVT